MPIWATSHPAAWSSTQKGRPENFRDGLSSRVLPGCLLQYSCSLGLTRTRPHRQVLTPLTGGWAWGVGRLKKRLLPRRLRKRHPRGCPKTTVPAQLRVGAAPGDPRKRPFTRCCTRARPGLLRKRPKVCALIQQGAADPCFVALAICITPGRRRTCFRGAATPKVKRILLAFLDTRGPQRSKTSGRPSRSRMEFMMECTPPLGTRTGCMTWRSGTAFTSTFAGTASSTTMA